MTWDITQGRKLYLNGVLIGVSTAVISNDDTQHFIGRHDLRSHRVDDADYFNGQVDEFAYYNYALDSTTIQSHYEAYLLNN